MASQPAVVVLTSMGVSMASIANGKSQCGWDSASPRAKKAIREVIEHNSTIENQHHEGTVGLQGV